MVGRWWVPQNALVRSARGRPNLTFFSRNSGRWWVPQNALVRSARGRAQPYVFFRWGPSSPSKFLVIYKCKTVAYMMKKSSQPLLFCIIFEHSEFTIYSISSVEIGAGRGRSAGGGCPKMRWYGQLGVAPKDCQNSGLSGFRNSAPGRAGLRVQLVGGVGEWLSSAVAGRLDRGSPRTGGSVAPTRLEP